MTSHSSRKWVLTAISGLLIASVVVSGCKKKNESEKSPKPAISQPDRGEVPRVMMPPMSGGGTNMVVQVGEMKLTEAELNQQLQKVLMSQGMDRMPPDQAVRAQAEMKANLVDGFIAQSVLLAEAERVKMAVTPEEVENVIKDIKSRAPAGVTFEQALQDFGITETKLREDIGRDLKIKKLVDGYLASVEKPSDKEVKAFYEEQASSFERQEMVQASHILLTCAPDASDAEKKEKMEKIEKIRKELDGGADFAELAKKHSDCPSKAKGGDLGSFPRGGMVPPFEKAAFSQKVNEIGPVVTTKFGYHIVKVAKHDAAGKVPLDEVKEKIEEHLLKQTKQELIMKKIGDLRAKADIKYAEGMKPSVPQM